MTREERDAHLAALRHLYTRVRHFDRAEIWTALVAWSGRHRGLALGLAAADARGERRNRAA